ncbi:O-antigen ligase [Salinibacterium sp. ZJ450]|uniref:O-antigen ligase family protein n=1 Tax=Salinibacterium sp. ZJ450 TaxID=2708338 RepID=UPI00141F9589|nr:O-antigen ligase family protein [Salinibacterium sp. ZJ450]
MTEARDIRVVAAGFLFFVGIGGAGIRNALGWWGWGAAIAAATVITIVWLVRERPRPRLPYSLIAWLALSALSLIWSAYPLSTLMGVGAQWLAVLFAIPMAATLSRAQLSIALGAALRWILGLSFLFELIVSWFVRHPVAPLWLGIDWEDSLKMHQWSRNVLFVDGKIQGIVGNSTALATVAAVAVIVFAIQMVDQWNPRGKRTWNTGWLVIAVGVVLMTRSAGVLVALLAAAAVLLLVLALRAATTRRMRITIAAVAIAAAAAALIAVTFFSEQLLGLLGKDSTLTNRTEIWDIVIGVADDRPVLGWGWVSYWTPWTEPFTDLVTINGVVQTHAHNAWLDVWLQLGIVGLVVFAVFIIRTLIRAWFAAVDRRRLSRTIEAPYDATSLLPLLVLTLLLVQTASESHLLVEGWWLVLATLAIKLKTDALRDPARL